MGTSKEDIKQWLEEAKASGSTHMIVVCDTFDWEDYPVHVSKAEDVKEIVKKYDGVNMQKVMEVYSLTENHDTQKQLSEKRSLHYD